MWTVLAATVFVLAALPAVLFLRNLRDYQVPGRTDGRGGPVSILIPARDEENSIGAAVNAALASQGIEVEVIVLDDHSADATAAVVNAIPGARLAAAPPLPAGWAGKQHACHVLAGLARHELLLFIDADVRLAPDGVARLVHYLDSGRADLVSGVPRQETRSPLEALVIPLIHFLLLCYLPLRRMRKDRHPAFGAGCGQLFLTRRTAYEKAGSHAAIRASFHDGVQLPRAYRRVRLRTDLCDATDVAGCRMYDSARKLWLGLAKNAGEGIGSPRGIVPWTVLLAGGHVLPFTLLACWPVVPDAGRWLVLAACVMSLMPRFIAVRRFRQPWWSAALHPVGVGVLLAIQWYALARRLLGRPVGWKGRAPAFSPERQRRSH